MCLPQPARVLLCIGIGESIGMCECTLFKSPQLLTLETDLDICVNASVAGMLLTWQTVVQHMSIG